MVSVTQVEPDGIRVDATLVVALDYVPPALLGNLHRINQVRAVRSGTAQHARQAGIAQQVGVAGRDFAEVVQPHRVRVAGKKVRREIAQLLETLQQK